MNEPVWTNSMCNEIGRLYQGWGKHAGKNTIYLILHRDKPKDIIATYVISVCYIRQQKTETHRTILTAGGNIIYYPV